MHGDPAEAAGLVLRVRNGDLTAFESVYKKYHRLIYEYLRRRTGSHQLAEDLTSETFVRALRATSGFGGQGTSLGAWLTTIARNLAADHFRSAATRLDVLMDELGSLGGRVDGPEPEVIRTLTTEELVRALTRLTPRQRACIYLRFFHDRSIAETAVALGCSDGAVKQLQFKGVRILAATTPRNLLCVDPTV